jgi:REP element-mobilizing transposase RayT
MQNPLHKNLPRLPREFYRGRAAVHWTFTIADRATGWLTPLFHARFREVLLHALIRQSALCPVYCLMPDHLHLLLIGCTEDSDLYLAAKFLRLLLGKAISPHRLQKQGYDHVLRESEMERHAFVAVAQYIAENPVRGALCAAPAEYPFLDALVPGFPNLSFHAPKFWEIFWGAWANAADGPRSDDRGYEKVRDSAA